MRLLFLFSLAISISVKSIHAQQMEQILVRVLDSENSEPISFATVIIKDSNLGVIADYNGEFRIPLKYKDNTIIISSIGYKTTEIVLFELDINTINILKIIPQVEALNAVIINSRAQFNVKNIIKASRGMTAKEMVVKAIERIPENLSNTPHSYIGYYRDYQLVDNKFHNLNEAMLETFDNGIDTNILNENTSKTAIYSFKQNTDFTQDTALTKAYNGITKYIEKSQIPARGGNEYTILNIHNPIRNFNFSTFSYVYTLQKDFPALHEFKRNEIVYLDNEPLVIIKFKKPERSHNTNLHEVKTSSSRFIFVEGSIYISLVDFSIHRFNYKVFVPRSHNILFNISLEYARQNNKMYLNYITFNNAFVAAEDFVLREEKVEFDKSEQAFYVTFNNTKDQIDFKTMKSGNFKFKLGKKHLKAVSVEKIDERVFKINLERLIGPDRDIDINSDNVAELTYKFKKIKDVKGRKIYDQRTIKGDQFREFFVQKVNLAKQTPSTLKFMKKNSPIIEAPLNNFPDANQYWINSPLMDNKYKDQEN